LQKNKCDFNDGAGYVLCGCTSTLIADQYAITASHCLQRTGSPNLALEFVNGQLIEVIESTVYPGAIYDPSLKLSIGLTLSINDFGIQKLKSKPKGIVPFHLTPAPAHQGINGDQASVRGWGISVNDINVALACFFYPQFCYPTYEAATLQQIGEKINPNQACQVVLSEFGINYNVHDGLVCTTPQDLSLDPFGAIKRGPCVGDSGSPLIVERGNKQFIVGLFTDTWSFTNPFTGTTYPCGNGMDLWTYMNNDRVNWIKKQVK